MAKIQLENIVSIKINPITQMFYAEIVDTKGESSLAHILSNVTLPDGITKAQAASVLKAVLYGGAVIATGVPLEEIKIKLQDYASELQSYINLITGE